MDCRHHGDVGCAGSFHCERGSSELPNGLAKCSQETFGSESCLSFSSFCIEFVTGLAKWLELSEAVLPTMTAFASGLGGEGADMFAQILTKDPVLKDDPLVITQVHPPPGWRLPGQPEQKVF